MKIFNLIFPAVTERTGRNDICSNCLVTVGSKSRSKPATKASLNDPTAFGRLAAFVFSSQDEQPEIFDGKGNRVGNRSQRVGMNTTDTLLMIRLTHQSSRPMHCMKPHLIVFDDILSAWNAQHRERAGVFEKPKIYLPRCRNC